MYALILTFMVEWFPIHLQLLICDPPDARNTIWVMIHPLRSWGIPVTHHTLSIFRSWEIMSEIRPGRHALNRRGMCGIHNCHHTDQSQDSSTDIYFLPGNMSEHVPGSHLHFTSLCISEMVRTTWDQSKLWLHMEKWCTKWLYNHIRSEFQNGSTHMERAVSKDEW